jgi:hypothetical protein
MTELVDGFMRAVSALLLLVTLWSGEAAASSFLVLPAFDGKSSPSMVSVAPPPPTDVTTLGAPDQTAPDVTIGEVDKPPQEAADGSIVMLSPSIVAMGEPAVAQEKVAAIGEEGTKPRPEPLPMVIRGGILGDAFSTAATGEPVPLTVEPKEAGQQPSSAPPHPKGAPRPDEQTTKTEPPEPTVPEPDIKME